MAKPKKTQGDVQVGGRYTCKIGRNAVEVTIQSERTDGGWDATTEAGKQIVIRSEARLRGAAPQGARVAPAPVEAAQDAKAKKGRDTAQQGAPEATPQADERACYVCHKPIKDGQAQAIGKGLCRHKDCDPVETPADEKPKAKRAGKTSLLDAAIQVLGETGQPMGSQDVVKAVLDKGLWTTKGKTPASTLYASILREIQAKGDDARFVKTDRGKFALRS